MKQLFLALTLAALSACGTPSAESTILAGVSSLNVAGKTFCRTVERDGSMGQPKGSALQCVTFKNSFQVVDNSSSFFGNPPEHGTYIQQGRTITVQLIGRTGAPREKVLYSLSKDGIALTDLDGSRVLTLQVNAR